MFNNFLKILLLAMSPLFVTQVMALEVGDDGLHKTKWMQDTFKDLREDLEEANAEGKRLVLFFEQIGCIYLHQDAQRGFLKRKDFKLH